MHGRSALVTGASRGIGYAIAHALTSAGVRTILLARNAESLNSACRELGVLAQPLVCDVNDEAAVHRAAAHVQEELGGAPDILVNNAGLFPLASVEGTSPEDFAATLRVNVQAPFLFVHAFLSAMRVRGSGDIVTIGSVADRVTFPENSAYAASKHAQRAFHEVLRSEVRGSGIRTMLVSPGPVDTDIWNPINPDAREGFPPRALMLRADDVAEAVLWGVSRPEHVTIEEIRVARS
jgi:NADP-dependent 3-hydroxy acid dehydrogenase YdfG